MNEYQVVVQVVLDVHVEGSEEDAEDFIRREVAGKDVSLSVYGGYLFDGKAGQTVAS